MRLTPSFEAKNRAQIQNVAKTPNPIRASGRVRIERVSRVGVGDEGGVSMPPTLGGIHSDWLDGPKVDSKWQFPAHSDNDAFNVLLGRRQASCHSS